MRSFAAVVLALTGSAYAQQTVWGQCGGQGWTGPTTCASGSVCTYSNAWYSQCLPGTASSTAATSSSKSAASTSKPASSSAASSKSVSVATSSSPTSSGSVATGTAGSGPGTTLTTGWYWIRAVEAPNFHKYLQTNPEYTTGTAIMDDYTKAGQFNIISGQLVELVTGGNLYAVVSPQTDSNVTKLAVTFSKTQNTYGTFAFSGDAVEWSIPSITRPNLAAWLVCANQQLFINLGAYAYMTPTGCADETIHYYNGATAVS